MQAERFDFMFGRYTDIFLLGGGSILAFILIRCLHISLSDLGILAATMLVLSHFVNHPHFAHSYQLFYGRIGDLTASASTAFERRKVTLVAYGVPLMLLCALLSSAWAWRQGEGLPMGLMINAMLALVGWHYVKQGFGMAMTDAALKKAFWSPTVRKALLINAYLCWISTWLYLNSTGIGSQFWGIFYARMNIPTEVVYAVAGLTLVSTLRVGLFVHRDFCRHQRKGRPWSQMPWAGLVGYFVSLYLWTLFASIDAAYLLVIPFFHSLQYLTVVYRCKLHELGGDWLDGGTAWRLAKFFGVGLTLGFLGFWLIPGYLDFAQWGLMWTQVSEPALALACFWLFINVHHYFIDNVIWRATNPYVKEHLFGKPRLPASERSLTDQDGAAAI